MRVMMYFFPADEDMHNIIYFQLSTNFLKKIRILDLLEANLRSLQYIRIVAYNLNLQENG